MRKYQTIQDIKAQNPGVKAWILQTPGGASFIHAAGDEEPTTKVCLLGTIER